MQKNRFLSTAGLLTRLAVSLLLQFMMPLPAFSQDDMAPAEKSSSNLPIIAISSNVPVHQLNPSFLGENAENAFSAGMPDWDSLVTIDALKQLRSQNLRFPGGTIANYWDWETGALQSSVSNNNFSYITGYVPTADKLSDFAYMSRASGSDPVFDLNVMTYRGNINTSVDEKEMIANQLAMLGRASSDFHLPIKFIELGNEICYGEDTGNIPTSNNDYYRA